MKRTHVVVGICGALALAAGVGFLLRWLRDRPIEPESLPSIILGVRVLPQSAPLSQKSSAGQPIILESAPDEEPLGPQSFDVIDKNSIVLADTASNRLLMISPTHKVEAQLRLPFSPERVLSHDEGRAFLVRNGSTGEMFRVERSGNIERYDGKWETLFPFDNLGLCRLLGSNRGEIQFRQDVSRSEVPVQFQFQEEGSRLETIRSLGSEAGRFVYAFVETAPRGGITASSAVVLKLLSNGALKCRIPLSSGARYAYAEDSVRVKNGLVYEMVLRRDAIEIKQWDTN